MTPQYLRAVTREDIGAIAALERICFEEPWPPVAFAQFVEADGFLAAVDPGGTRTESDLPDGALAGYVVTTPSSQAPTTVAHIRNIAVDPAHRRRGLASRLLERSLQPYAMEGFARARLEVRESNTAAIELYRDRGYEIARHIHEYYADGETALVMERTLAESAR